MSYSDSLDLFDAILGNSLCLVKWFLEHDRKDPNARPKLSLLSEIPKTHDGGIDGLERILAEDVDYKCTSLHVAIVNCYHHGRMDGVCMKQRQQALGILESLLEAGADVGATCHKILFCHVGGINISSPGAPLDPIGLTLSLKKVRPLWKNPHGDIHGDEVVDMMDCVMERLIRTKQKEQQVPIPVVTVPKLIRDMYHDLALSETCADVRVVCLEGKELPAHRNVLVASSSVLAQRILANSTNDVSVWRVQRPEHVMRSVLYFLYTGSMDARLLETETATLLSIASEYELESLEQACAQICGERLTIRNVRLMMDIGERHNARWIKKECFGFLQTQPIPLVLGNPKLLALAKENPKLWEELLMVIGGQAVDPNDGSDETVESDYQQQQQLGEVSVQVGDDVVAEQGGIEKDLDSLHIQ